MNKSRETQVARYGGEDGYRKEMARRRKLVKNPGFAAMDPEKRVAAARLGGLNSRKNKDGKKEESETAS